MFAIVILSRNLPKDLLIMECLSPELPGPPRNNKQESDDSNPRSDFIAAMITFTVFRCSAMTWLHNEYPRQQLVIQLRLE